MSDKIRIGISSCLLGNNVRFDGGHKLDRLIRDVLGAYLDFVPVCPEVEVGLPTPRETLRLVGEPDQPRLVFGRSGEDITERMQDWAHRRCDALEQENLCGFIFKSRSPSSGMERVKLYDKNGVPSKQGVGIFAGIFMERFPLVPVEEDGRLHDDKLRENFIETLFTFKRWRDLVARGMNAGDLVDFHSRHKLLLLAHSPQVYREMGKLVAEAGKQDMATLQQSYVELLMKALRLKTTVNKNLNVLEHLLGYFKRELTADEKQEMLESFASYRAGHVPLIVPITLINHYVRKYDQTYLKTQFYLNPHPLELQLRNHV